MKFGPTALLARLILLRGATVGAYLLAMLVGSIALNWALPLAPLGLICALLLVYDALSYSRLRCSIAVSENEIARQLAVDIVAHALWLFFVGGSTNPFTAMFLMPVIIAAASLPPRQVWPLTLLTLLCYSLLLVWYQPLPIPESALAQAFFLHTLGMWLAFVAAALIVAGLVTQIGRQLRRQDQALAQARESALRQQQLMSLALQAGGAAHRLGSPLNTMWVLLDEMRAQYADKPDLQADLDILQQQLQACRLALTRLRTNPQKSQARAVGPLLRDLFEDWCVLHPQQQAQLNLANELEQKYVQWDFALEQALLNLLDNALRASPDWQGLSAQEKGEWLYIAVEDAGPGFDGRVKPTAESSEGLGMGLLLAQSAIESAGGQLQWLPRTEQGCQAELQLPLFIPPSPK